MLAFLYMGKILLIDDDPTTHAIVRSSVQGQAELLSTYNLKDAQKFLETESPPDLIIIDRMLPDGDGLNLCGYIKSSDRLQSIPILFLSSKDSESDKVTGLFAGADDYLAKPFGVLELKARIQARLRQSRKTLSVGDLVLDLSGHQAYKMANGKKERIDLTQIEFKLLSVFTQSIDRVYSREQILSKVWGDNCHLSDRVVDTHISHLRKKIGKSGVKLEALRGEGYRMTLVDLPYQAAKAA